MKRESINGVTSKGEGERSKEVKMDFWGYFQDMNWKTRDGSRVGNIPNNFLIPGWQAALTLTKLISFAALYSNEDKIRIKRISSLEIQNYQLACTAKSNLDASIRPYMPACNSKVQS